MPVRVVLADDALGALEGVQERFRLEDDFLLLMRCTSGEETLQAVRTLKPDVLVLPLDPDHRGGFDVLRRVDEEDLPTRVVVVASALDDRRLLEVIRLGAQGIVPRDQAAATLPEAVREVAAGSQWLEDGLGGRALRQLLDRESGLREAARLLTPRELDVVRMVAQGMRNRAIGEKLYLSEGAVEMHLANVCDKLRVRGRLELALYARSRGWV